MDSTPLPFDTVGEIQQERCKTPFCYVVVLEQLGERCIAQWAWQTCAQRFASSWVVTQTEIAPNNVLEKAYCLAVDDLCDHVVENSADSIKAFVCLADVRQAHIVQEDLLYDEDRHRLAQFAACLHDTQAERNDLRRQEEGNHIRVVILLHKRANHA